MPPNGMSDQHSAVFSELTRPSSAFGIRSKITAPSTGLRKPEAHPPITLVSRITHSGDPTAYTRNRGRPVMRNAATYVGNRGRRSPNAAATTEPPIEAPAQTANTRPRAPAPAPVSFAQTGISTADHARSSRLVAATISD